MSKDVVGVDRRLLIGYLTLPLAPEMLRMSQPYRITNNGNITNYYGKMSMLHSFMNSTNNG